MSEKQDHQLALLKRFCAEMHSLDNKLDERPRKRRMSKLPPKYNLFNDLVKSVVNHPASLAILMKAGFGIAK